MPAHCKLCNKLAQGIEKPLYQCVECKNYYHGSCHRYEPKPRNNLNWACKGCVSKLAGTQHTSQRHHDPARQDRFIVSSSKPMSSINRQGSSTDSMNRTSSISTASVASHESGTSNPYLWCAWFECKQPRPKDGIWCLEHQQHPAIRELPGTAHAPAPINTMPPSTNSTQLTSVHRSIRDPVKKKLLGGDQGNRVSRKSGANPSFQPVRPIAKEETPPVVEHWPQEQQALPTGPAILPRTNENLVIDEEPPRKRSRVSPVMDTKSNCQANGVEQRLLESRSRAPISPPLRPTSSQRTVQATFPVVDNPRETQDNPPKMGFRLTSRKGAPPRKMASNYLPLSYEESRRLQEADGSSIEPPRERKGNMRVSQDKDREEGSLGVGRNTASRWQPRDVQPDSFYRSTAPDPKTQVLRNGLNRYEAAEDEKPNGCKYREAPRFFCDDSQKPVVQGVAPPQQHTIKPLERRTFEELRFRSGVSKPVAPLKHSRSIDSAQDRNQEAFDALFYQQVGTAEASGRGDLASPAISADARTAEPLPPDKPLFMDIDPRIHWPQDHSEQWFESKAEEIKARGGRKANFGKAAQRLKQQRLKAEPVPFEETLPEKIAANPAWVRLLRMLDGVEENGSLGEKGFTSKGRRGMGKRQGSDRANGTVNGHVNGYTNGANGVV